MIIFNYAITDITKNKAISDVFSIFFINSFIFTYIFYRANGFSCILTVLMLILAKIDIIYKYSSLFTIKNINQKKKYIFIILLFLFSFGYWICDGFTYKKDTLIFCYILTMSLINILN